MRKEWLAETEWFQSVIFYLDELINISYNKANVC